MPAPPTEALPQHLCRSRFGRRHRENAGPALAPSPAGSTPVPRGALARGYRAGPRTDNLSSIPLEKKRGEKKYEIKAGNQWKSMWRCSAAVNSGGASQAPRAERQERLRGCRSCRSCRSSRALLGADNAGALFPAPGADKRSLRCPDNRAAASPGAHWNLLASPLTPIEY